MPTIRMFQRNASTAYTHASYTGLGSGSGFTYFNHNATDDDAFEWSDLFIDSSDLPDDWEGFVQCLFLLAIYMGLVGYASILIAYGSELLIFVPSVSNLVGSVILPIFGQLADIAIILFSCIGAQAQEELVIGVGALAGSNVFMLTILWWLSVLLGRVDVDEKTGLALYDNRPKLQKTTADNSTPRAFLLENGVEVGPQAKIAAIFMLITSTTFLVILYPNIALYADPRELVVTDEKSYALGAFCMAMALFIFYMVNQFIMNYASEKIETADDQLRDEVIVRSIRGKIVTLLAAINTEVSAAEKEEYDRSAKKISSNDHDSNNSKDAPPDSPKTYIGAIASYMPSFPSLSSGGGGGKDGEGGKGGAGGRAVGGGADDDVSSSIPQFSSSSPLRKRSFIRVPSRSLFARPSVDGGDLDSEATDVEHARVEVEDKGKEGKGEADQKEGLLQRRRQLLPASSSSSSSSSSYSSKRTLHASADEEEKDGGGGGGGAIDGDKEPLLTQEAKTHQAVRSKEALTKRAKLKERLRLLLRPFFSKYDADKMNVIAWADIPLLFRDLGESDIITRDTMFRLFLPQGAKKRQDTVTFDVFLEGVLFFMIHHDDFQHRAHLASAFFGARSRVKEDFDLLNAPKDADKESCAEGGGGNAEAGGGGGRRDESDAASSSSSSSSNSSSSTSSSTHYHQLRTKSHFLRESKAEHDDALRQNKQLFPIRGRVVFGNSGEYDSNRSSFDPDDFFVGGGGGDGEDGNLKLEEEAEGGVDGAGDFPKHLLDLSPEEQQASLKWQASLMLVAGLMIIILFVDPLVDVMSELGDRCGVSAFYVSFVLSPIAGDISMLVAAWRYAQKKSAKTISITQSALLGSVTINNTLVLGLFMILIWSESLAWEFLAETIVILGVELIVGAMIFRDTHMNIDGFAILLLYPLSIATVAIFEYYGFN